MKKLVLIVSMILVSSQSFAGVSSNFSLTSDYVWRGISQTGNSPAVQGGIDYAHSCGGAIGLWSSSLFGNAETDFYASYALQLGSDLSLGIGYTFYYYTNSEQYNFQEAKIFVSHPIVDFNVNYTDDYARTGTAGLYYNLIKKVSLVEDLGLKLSLGYTTFNNEDLAGSKNYLDYLVALTRKIGDFELANFFTNTTRKIIDGSTTEKAKEYVVGISVTFSK